VIKMADAGVLPYDYATYASEIEVYLQTVTRKASEAGMKELKFDAATAAAQRFSRAAATIQRKERSTVTDIPALNQALLKAEHALLSNEGLPGRPWYRHTIYAPGEFTGYAAVVLPGVNEAIDAHDAARTQREIGILSAALDRASAMLESAE
jgi:N-acetylated-alpha-linked acidic dipeptidase